MKLFYTLWFFAFAVSLHGCSGSDSGASRLTPDGYLSGDAGDTDSGMALDGRTLTDAASDALRPVNMADGGMSDIDGGGDLADMGDTPRMSSIDLSLIHI